MNIYMRIQLILVSNSSITELQLSVDKFHQLRPVEASWFSLLSVLTSVHECPLCFVGRMALAYISTYEFTVIPFLL